LLISKRGIWESPVDLIARIAARREAIKDDAVRLVTSPGRIEIGIVGRRQLAETCPIGVDDTDLGAQSLKSEPYRSARKNVNWLPSGDQEGLKSLPL
jgi:hypothetical protein